MDNLTLVIIIAAAVLVGAAVAWMVAASRRRRHLRERFGPEYEHAVAEVGSRRRAESELERREERAKQLHIRPLSSETRNRYAEEWRLVQERFVDNPSLAVAEANQLVHEVMRERGYPVEHFEQRAADISVDHPHVVEHYRAAYAIAQRSERGQANTEELRQAMVHYRTLFSELLEPEHTAHTPPVEARP